MLKREPVDSVDRLVLDQHLIGPTLSHINRSRCRSIRGLSAKPTRGPLQLRAALDEKASDRSSPLRFMARGITCLLRPAKARDGSAYDNVSRFNRGA